MIMQTRHHNSIKMFLRTSSIFISLLLFWQSGCKKEDAGPVQNSANDHGAITAVGTPTDSPSTAMIGASGGSLLSTNGRSEIIIPPGALTTNTQISIQPVTNESPGGTGDGFSFTPVGQTFSQPVTLRFHYTASDIAGSNIHELAIATQKDDHIWYSFNTVSLDSIAGTLSISTTHFTLYSLLNKFRITPDAATIAVNATQALRVVMVGKAPNDPDPNDDLTPLNPLITYPNGNEVSWTVNGLTVGALDNGDVNPKSGSSTATYTAPATTNDMTSNPAAVTAQVDILGASKLYLISNITVLGGDKTYDVKINLIGTNMPGTSSDFSFSYSDDASFIVTTYANADSVHASSITNTNGKITDFSIHNVQCQLTPNDQGNLLDIQSVSGTVLHQLGKPDRMFLVINSTSTMFAVTETCQNQPKTIPGSSGEFDYTAQTGDLNTSTQSINLVQNTTGEVVTLTITPH
jgi:hypothetical protein